MPLSKIPEHGALIVHRCTTEEVYEIITGYKGTIFPISIPTNQGWRNLAVPRSMIAFGLLCEKVRNVSPLVIEAFGGRDPFKSLEIFQHYLATIVSELGTFGDEAFLWSCRKSDLRIEKQPNCKLVSYDSEMSRTTLSRPPTLGSVCDGDAIARDSFVGAFLTLPKGSDTTKHIKENLAADAWNEFQDEYESSPIVPCHRIILVQAYIIFFYKNMGASVKTSVPLSKYSKVVDSMYPASNPKGLREATKGWFSLNGFKDSLERYKEVDSMQKLRTFAMNHWNLSEGLVKAATRFLKSPQELLQIRSHSDAWVVPHGGGLHYLLENLQRENSLIANLNSSNLFTACSICSHTGILTLDFFDAIQSIRHGLRRSVEEYHQDLTPARLALCESLVQKYRIEGTHTRFNFDPKYVHSWVKVG